MTEQAIEAALETDPEPVFRTEVLCQWVEAVEPAINLHAWDALPDARAPRGTGPVFALDVAPDHSTASLAVAWTRPDRAVQVMLADHRPGVEWVVPRVESLLSAWGGRLIVEQTGTAGFLLPALERARVTLDPQARRFYVDACSALDAAVTARQVRHGHQPELNAAVAAARWSTSGDAGQRVLSRKDPRVSPLVAATLALRGVTVPRRRGARGWWGCPKRPIGDATCCCAVKEALHR